MNCSAPSLHSTRLTRQTHPAWRRDDCHQPLMQRLSLRCACLSHNLKKENSFFWEKQDGREVVTFVPDAVAVESERDSQSCQCGWQTECTLTPVRLVSHSFGKASQPRPVSSILCGAGTGAFKHRCLTAALRGVGSMRDNTPRVELCSVILAQRGGLQVSVTFTNTEGNFLATGRKALQNFSV